MQCLHNEKQVSGTKWTGILVDLLSVVKNDFANHMIYESALKG